MSLVEIDWPYLPLSVVVRRSSSQLVFNRVRFAFSLVDVRHHTLVLSVENLTMYTPESMRSMNGLASLVQHANLPMIAAHATQMNASAYVGAHQLGCPRLARAL